MEAHCSTINKKTQRQILGFNLKIRKAIQPATGSYLYLSLKMAILPLGMRLRAVSSCFIVFSSAGIKVTTTTARFLWQLVWLLGLKVCATTARSVRLTDGAVLLIGDQASFIY